MKGLTKAAAILSASCLIYNPSISTAFSIVNPSARSSLSLKKSTGSSQLFVATEPETTSTSLSVGKPGTAELGVAWSELGFEFRPTKSHLQMVYKDGEWQEPKLVEVRFSPCACSFIRHVTRHVDVLGVTELLLIFLVIYG
mmetsp:Transcript_23952/g.35183  ORF Transcript_23952/g.35183 Transcript_23952/m.35183 type:complete len:141 (+) Transcript_23952:58-480(+)